MEVHGTSGASTPEVNLSDRPIVGTLISFADSD